jgi:MFS family permease
MAVTLFALGIVGDPLLFATIFIVETVAFALMLPAAMAIFSEAVENHPERTKVIGTMAFVTELLSLPPAFLLPFLYAMHPGYSWGAVALLCIGTFLIFDSSRRRVMKAKPASTHERRPLPVAPEPRKQEQA